LFPGDKMACKISKGNKYRNRIGKAGHCWLTPVILAIEEAEIRRIVV
jgi:hypothetical protein